LFLSTPDVPGGASDSPEIDHSQIVGPVR
jgi:hypothetical protein